MRIILEYNKINNSFKEKLIYHVGTDDGFHAEVDAMMECLLYCYENNIRFILYTDDVNFAGGHGWNDFFSSFCSDVAVPTVKNESGLWVFLY